MAVALRGSGAQFFGFAGNLLALRTLIVRHEVIHLNATINRSKCDCVVFDNQLMPPSISGDAGITVHLQTNQQGIKTTSGGSDGRPSFIRAAFYWRETSESPKAFFKGRSC